MQPSVVTCDECRRLVRTLRAAWRADASAIRTRLARAADSAGRDAAQFAIGWVFSVAKMPDDEMKTLLDAHYPTVSDANRKREAHETASGHSLKGWWVLSHYVRDGD